VLRETLRLTSPITARGAGPIEDTVLRDGDKVYEVKKGSVIIVSYFSVHRDTAIWGEDVSIVRRIGDA
jgi:cytochrome P450